MSTQLVLMHQTPPKLIDNELNLFQLDNLSSTLNSFQLMANLGNGLSPVSFDLHRIRDRSHSQALRLLVETIASDLSVVESQQIETKIQSVETLEDALRVINDAADHSAIRANE